MPQRIPSTRPTDIVRAMGGFSALFLFLLALAAFVIQSSLTQYVQSDLGFRQPYFLLYLSHTSFTTIFPIHVLYLTWTTGTPLTAYFSRLRKALASRLSASNGEHFPIYRLSVLILGLTAGINIPALLWYAAVSLTSISDVTALWNTNSFWVYVLSAWMCGTRWELRKLGAVLLATIGVIVDVYGGSTTGGSSDSLDPSTNSNKGPSHEASLPSTAPLAGDLLTLTASIAYALYQVLYKRYAALPSDDITGTHTPLPKSRSNFRYQSLEDPIPASLISDLAKDDDDNDSEEEEEDIGLPLGLYANLLTSSVGLATAILLGLGFPLLHWSSLERFRLPPDTHTTLCAAGIAISGLTFNASFMILLGLWGPVLTSVGNLLTIVLVIIADFFFNHGAITIWSLIGAVMIASAFGILALDVVRLK